MPDRTIEHREEGLLGTESVEHDGIPEREEHEFVVYRATDDEPSEHGYWGAGGPRGRLVSLPFACSPARGGPT